MTTKHRRAHTLTAPASLVVALLGFVAMVAAAPAATAAPPAPSILSVTPAPTVGLGAGESSHPARQVVIHVANVATTDGVTLAFPSWSGLSASVVSKTVDGTHTDVTALVSTSSTSTAGSAPDLTLTDTTTGGSDHVTFTVNAAPSLTKATPSHVLRGTTTTLSLTGTGLQSGVLASAPAGRGVSFGAVSLSGGSTTTGSVAATVTPDAPAGPVAVTLTNPDGGWSTNADAFDVATFAVTDIVPVHASNSSGNTAVPLTVTGTAIPAGNTVLELTPTFSVSGQPQVVVSPTSISADGTTWKGNANLANDAPGSYRVQLVNGSDVGTLTTKNFTVDSAGAPTITSVSPAQIVQGADATVTITGTNFAHGAVVTLSKGAFTTTGPVIVDSATQLRVPVHVSSNAATGVSNATNLTVTNTGPTPNSATRTAAISATTGPTISSLTPKPLGQGAATTLTINGSNFDVHATVTFGNGVVATGAPTIGSTQIKIPVKVDAHAPTSVTVRVQNPNGGAATSTLTISAFALTGVSPHYVPTSFSGNIVLTGTGFATGATVTFPSGSGVVVQSGRTASVSNSGTTLTVPIVVARSTPVAVDVTVTNSGNNLGTATCPGCLGVAVPPTAPQTVQATKSGTSATVTWVAPADAGGAPLTSYIVSVTDPANSGIGSQSLSPSATGTTFGGLAADRDYTFAVVATNAANLSSSPATATTSRQSRLTIQASDRRVPSGQSVRLHGILLDVHGLPISSAAVTVHRRGDSGRNGVVATVTTDADGQWSLLVRPAYNQTYDAAFGGDANDRASNSGTVRVVAAARVTIQAAAASSSGRPLVVRGRVSPNKRGQTVRLVGRDSSGRLHHLGAVFLGPHSTYEFRVPLRPGNWRLQVRIGRSGGNGAGRSSLLRVSRD